MATFAGNRIYAHPRLDAPQKVDAVFVLGGPGLAERYDVGVKLVENGWATNLVISDSNSGQTWTCNSRVPVSKGGVAITRWCLVPKPATTRGEASEFRDLAVKNNWHSVILVTFRPHISRSRFIFERCFEGRILTVEAPLPISRKDWVFEVGYQTLGYIKAVLGPKC